MKLLLLIALLINTYCINAENIGRVDSLQNQILTTSVDSIKFNLYLDIYEEYKSFSPDSSIKYVKLALNIAERTNNVYYLSRLNNRIGSLYARIGENNEALNYYNTSLKYEKEKKDSIGIAGSFVNIGTAYQNMGNYPLSLDYFFKALNIFKQFDNQRREVYCYINLGITYDIIDDNEKCLKYYLLGLDISKELEDDYLLGYVYLNLGILYDDIGEIDKALECYRMLLKLLEGSDNYSSLGNTYNNIACVHEDLNDFDMALEYYNKALEVWIKHNGRAGEAGVYSNMAGVYTKQLKFELAEEHYLKSIRIREELFLPHPLAVTYLGIGQLYADLKNYKTAENYYIKSITILDTLMAIEDLAIVNRELSYIYGVTNRYKEAYESQKTYKLLSDSLSNEEEVKKITQMQMQYDFNKAMEIKDIEDQKKELEHKTEITKKEYENKKQRIIILSAAGLFILLLGFVFMILKQNREKKRANIILHEQKEEIEEQNEELNQQSEELHLLNESLHQQNEEITTQRDEIEQQKNIIEEIHQEVSQSIDYATRLQESILPEDGVLIKYFSDQFVLFKPKDKVSGDFYWWTHIENHTVITAADSTGHGVPGAFMSMLGVSFLREIVQKEYVTHPGVILRKLRKEIIKALRQKGEPGEQKDGMDMALISVNHETNILQYSGANNPLYIIKPSINNKIESFCTLAMTSDDFSLYEIKPDKMPIAIYEKMDKFQTHELQLEKGDQLIMFSDGYPDQFGGPKGKKLKYKPFKKLLLENAHLRMEQQKDILYNAFMEWKGAEEQVDDVVIVGIKI